MNRFFLLLLPLGFVTSASAQEASRKFTVLPFAALSGDVPQRAGVKAAGMLTTELRNAEGFAPTETKKSPKADPHQDGLAKARNSVEEAQKLRTARKFRLAEDALQKALTEYKTASAGLTDVGELVDTFALLAAVQFNTGQDEEGQKSLDTAIGLAPTRELPLAKTSPLFSKVVEATRKGLNEKPKGSLLVESTPSGAGVLIDGVTLGSTPLIIKDIPAGTHAWRIQLPGEVAGGLTDVAANKQTKVNGQTNGQDAESKLYASLSQNRLDAAALAAAKEEATTAGADLVVFGALSRNGKDLALDSFVFVAASNEVKRLPRSQFDTELLSAGMELYNLAGAMKQKLSGESVRVPAQITQLGGGARVAEVQYGAKNAVKDVTDEQTPAKEEKREPLKRTPLRKQ
ncbi:MAG: PEGA domain-containing protein [Myxococcaceae bacterium]